MQTQITTSSGHITSKLNLDKSSGGRGGVTAHDPPICINCTGDFKSFFRDMTMLAKDGLWVGSLPRIQRDCQLMECSDFFTLEPNLACDILPKKLHSLSGRLPMFMESFGAIHIYFYKLHNASNEKESICHWSAYSAQQDSMREDNIGEVFGGITSLLF